MAFAGTVIGVAVLLGGECCKRPESLYFAVRCLPGLLALS